MPRKTTETTRAPAVPLRNFRAEDALWDPALTKARSKGETLSDVLRRALREYVEK